VTGDGPFGTREQAEAAFDGFRQAAQRGRSGPPGEELVFTYHQHLAEALADTADSCGLELGDYDRQLIVRLATMLDPVDTGVVCSWLTRAAEPPIRG
jgi:hypothetical protein